MKTFPAQKGTHTTRHTELARRVLDPLPLGQRKERAVCRALQRRALTRARSPMPCTGLLPKTCRELHAKKTLLPTFAPFAMCPCPAIRACVGSDPAAGRSICCRDRSAPCGASV